MSSIQLVHRLFAAARSGIVRQRDSAAIRVLLDDFKNAQAGAPPPDPEAAARASRDADLRSLKEGAEALEAENTVAVVEQIATMGRAIHDFLESRGDPRTAEANASSLYDRVYRHYWAPQTGKSKGLGLAFSAGNMDHSAGSRILEAQGRGREAEPEMGFGFETPSPSSSAASSAPSVSKAELRAGAEKALGFGLETGPSTIPHENAGMGLFLRGKARRGQLVGFYPGVVFLPQWHHYVPGFPCPDLENVYLMGRYDRAMIDGKSWGMGAAPEDISRVQPIPWESSFFDTDNLGPVLEAMRGFVARRTMGWGALGERYWDIEYDWRFVDLRNPYAAFHFANHPPKGTKPNVIKVPFELDPTEPGLPKWLRAHVPFLMYQAGAEKTREGASARPNETSPHRLFYKGGSVRGMAVLALRDLKDGEELFLDYRLNTTMLSGKPGWYHPVGSDAMWRWQFHSAVGIGGALGIREDLEDQRDVDRREEEARRKGHVL